MAKYRVQLELTLTCRKTDPAKLANLLQYEWGFEKSGRSEIMDVDADDYGIPAHYSAAQIRVKEIVNA